MKPVIAVPRGTILPGTLEVPVITDGTFIEKLVENSKHPIAIMALTTEELIALVEKPHLFGVDVVALVGAPGGRYDAVWSSYIAPLRRLSLETLDAEIKKILAQTSETEKVVPSEETQSVIRSDSRYETSSETDDDGVTE